MRKNLKAERRDDERRKAKHGPKGGTMAGQVARTRTARGYKGTAKKFIRKSNTG